MDTLITTKQQLREVLKGKKVYVETPMANHSLIAPTTQAFALEMYALATKRGLAFYVNTEYQYRGVYIYGMVV